eukprot:3756892-Pyramimonas_sp.AAC.1
MRRIGCLGCGSYTLRMPGLRVTDLRLAAVPGLCVRNISDAQCLGCGYDISRPPGLCVGDLRFASAPGWRVRDIYDAWVVRHRPQAC